MTNMKRYIESGNWKILPKNNSPSYVITMPDANINESADFWSNFFSDNESKKPPELDQELMDYLLS